MLQLLSTLGETSYTHCLVNDLETLSRMDIYTPNLHMCFLQCDKLMSSLIQLYYPPRDQKQGKQDSN